MEADTSIPEELEKDYRNYNPRINYKELIKYDNDEHISDKNLYVSKHVKSMKENIPEKYFDDKSMTQTEESLEDSFNTDAKKYNSRVKMKRMVKNIPKKMLKSEHFDSGSEPLLNQQTNTDM